MQLLSSHRSANGGPLGPNHTCSFCGQQKPRVIGIHLAWICQECCDIVREIFEHDPKERKPA